LWALFAPTVAPCQRAQCQGARVFPDIALLRRGLKPATCSDSKPVAWRYCGSMDDRFCWAAFLDFQFLEIRAILDR
jgi:hypothetical protein